jgi:hypothetical protein
MIRDSQRQDWQALVDYLTPFGNGACLNCLVEDGPDDVTDFKGLLEKFKKDDEEATCSHPQGVEEEA